MGELLGTWPPERGETVLTGVGMLEALPTVAPGTGVGWPAPGRDGAGGTIRPPVAATTPGRLVVTFPTVEVVPCVAAVVVFRAVFPTS